MADACEDGSAAAQKGFGFHQARRPWADYVKEGRETIFCKQRENPTPSDCRSSSAESLCSPPTAFSGRPSLGMLHLNGGKAIRQLQGRIPQENTASYS
jgi:hypothetical protein